MQKFQRISILLILFFFDISLPSTVFSSQFVTVQSLKEDLRSKDFDRIEESLSNVKRKSYKGHILPFIQDLWDQRKDKYPDLPWDVMEYDIVRVQLADILGQAVRNARIRMDVKPIHNFLVSLIDSTDRDVSRKALGALSMIGDETDVEKIFSVAKRMDRGTFRISVLTLTMMCNEKAARAVAKLEALVTNPDLRSFIIESRRDSEDFKKNSGWCN